MKKDIDRIEKELKENRNYDIFKEKDEWVQKEFTRIINNDYKDEKSVLINLKLCIVILIISMSF